MLVKFMVKNYRTIADAAIIDLNHLHSQADESEQGIPCATVVLNEETPGGRSDVLAALAAVSAAIGASSVDNDAVMALRQPHVYHGNEATEFRIVWLYDDYRFELQFTLDGEGITKELLRVHDNQRWRPLYTRMGANLFFHSDSGLNSSQIRDLTTNLNPWTLAASLWVDAPTTFACQEAIEWLGNSVLFIPPPFSQSEDYDEVWRLYLLELVERPETLGNMAQAIKSVDPGVESIVISTSGLTSQLRYNADVLNDLLGGRGTSSTVGTLDKYMVRSLACRMSINHLHGPALDAGAHAQPLMLASWMAIAAACAATRINEGIVVCDLSKVTLDSALITSLAYTIAAELNGQPRGQVIIAANDTTATDEIVRDARFDAKTLTLVTGPSGTPVVQTPQQAQPEPTTEERCMLTRMIARKYNHNPVAELMWEPIV